MDTVFKSKDDKLNYLKGLIRVAKCNGVVEPEEREFLEYAAYGLDLDSSDVNLINALWNDDNPISLSFSSKYNSLFFIQEAFQLCIVDGTFDDREQKEMALIASELGIKPSDYNQIFSWIMEGIEWKRRGENLLSVIAGGDGR